MSKMFKRTIILFVILFIAMGGVTANIYFIMNNTTITQAAVSQSSCKLEVASFRGTIYDFNMSPLVYSSKAETIAAITPSVEAISNLNNVFSSHKVKSIYNSVSEGKPFLLKLPDNSSQKISTKDIHCFSISSRYNERQNCLHIIGYLDSNQNGVCGIELSYNDYLKLPECNISLEYKTDALGRLLSGDEATVNDNSYLKDKGVVLTIDASLQDLAENTARKYLKKGAVVITEVPNCELRAIVSMPDYSPLDIGSALNQESSPLINRAFCPYNTGSVFKLVTTAAALENNYPADEHYHCCGQTSAGGMTFRCFNGISHGELSLNDAIAYSCNSYFVNVAKQIKQDEIIDMAKKLGFGKSLELAPNFSSSKGNLPKSEDLSDIKALANFSFGQGALMATPLQVCAMVNAIASEGVYTEPRLTRGLVDENKQWKENYDANIITREVMSPENAKKIQDAMISSVEYGTGSKGKPQNLNAGAKTGTAETGQYNGENEVIQSWFTGFYPSENPRYVITVLDEDSLGNGDKCSAVFKEIANNVYEILSQ